ncbi:uncharacterized protein [Apostichopus japonicus]|uniref:uncharacterized protein isoform X2 n=1 Tax=Stichopus japonicus TaxID=307972 RepID=UPI003AB2AD29
MPQVNRALMIQLGIILLIVPVQYFITQRWKPASRTTQQQSLKELIKQLKSWKDSIFSKATWQKWFKDAQSYIVSYKDSAVEKARQYATTSPAHAYEEGAEATLEEAVKKILKERDPTGNFGASAIPRNPRPGHIKYRIGQVIRHKQYGYRGVIVGWDATAKAPASWLDKMHGEHKLHLRNLPNYSVLVDVRDRQRGQITYVVEENIEIIEDHEVNHPHVKEYFNGFDGVQYIAKQWLKKIYPNDQ